ncbi:MAG: PAS domain S-box protein [Anaerolineae bacterium]|nr:PAS domain S-box protein [Anaerolineae bacterium]
MVEKKEKSGKKHSSSKQMRYDAAQLYHAIIDAVQDPVHIVDAELRFVFGNAAMRKWLKRLGHKKGARGESLFDLCPFLGEAQRHEYAYVLQNAKPFFSEDRIFYNGQALAAETQKIPLCDANGNVTHVVTVIHDISERVFASEQIQRLNAELERKVQERTRSLEEEIAARQTVEEQLRRQQRFAEALASAAADLNSTLDLETLLDRILDNIARVVPHDAADVMLIENGTAHVVRARGYEQRGVLEGVLALRFDVSQTNNLASMKEHKQPVVIPDVNVYPGWVYDPASSWIRSYASAPIVINEEVVGFLNVSSAQTGFFTPDDAARLKAFADHAGLAIKNARLYTAARREEERFNSLFNQTSVCIADTSGRFVQVSQHFCALVGYTQEELRQMTFQQLTHPDDLETDLSNVRRMERGEIDNFIIEKRYLHKNGSHVWVNINIYAVRDAQGYIKQTVGVAQDITQRKQMEAALRQGEQRFRSLFEQGAVGIVDRQGYFTEASRDLCRLLGYTLEELRSLTFQQLTHPDDLEKDLELTRRAYNGEIESFVIEKRFIRKDGGVVWVSMYVSPLRGEDGEVQGDLGVLHDITDRKRAEEALRQSEELFRSLFELSPFGASLTDLSGYYLRVNPAYCNMLGYSEQELLGLHYQAVSYPDEQEIETNRRLREQLLRGEINAFEMEKRFVHKDGRVLNAILRLTVARDANGAPLYMVGQIIDITERKRIEAEMIAAQKMTGLGTLAAGIAHELNTPLQIVTAASEILLQKLEEGKLEEDKLRRSLNNIHQSAWRMAETIRSLRVYTRSVEEAYVPHDLNAIVQDTLLLIEHQLKTWSNVAVETRLAQDMPPIRCERNKISQALINLLTNARDAMPEGGRIVITTDYDPQQQRFMLQVSDSGVGIPPEVQKRIFDPFYTTKGVGKGTGLGLSIVMGTVQAHGGEIQLESAPNAGATFTIYLPENPPDSGASPAKDPFAGTFDG